MPMSYKHAPCHPHHAATYTRSGLWRSTFWRSTFWHSSTPVAVASLAGGGDWGAASLADAPPLPTPTAPQ
eukprot:7384271-Prymnesium_polylepis.1